MQFKIEQFLTIKGKVYLLCSSLTPDIPFSLSTENYLGHVQIEKWFDIPRAIDENGNQKPGLFLFTLKNSSDKDKISVSDILELKTVI